MAGTDEYSYSELVEMDPFERDLFYSLLIQDQEERAMEQEKAKQSHK